jgi:hypothetical protein
LEGYPGAVLPTLLHRLDIVCCGITDESRLVLQAWVLADVGCISGDQTVLKELVIDCYADAAVALISEVRFMAIGRIGIVRIDITLPDAKSV